MIAAEMVLMANFTVLVFQIISYEKLKREETSPLPFYTFQLAYFSSIIAIMFEKGKLKFFFISPAKLDKFT